MSTLLACLFALSVGLQSGGPFEMRKSVIAAGGDTVQSTAPGSSFLLSSSLGQPSTTTSTAGAFQLSGGFWAGLEGASVFSDGFEAQTGPNPRSRSDR
ncbi:hypothetical protein [Halomonas denitrificans]|nr:hypothetical protein [Halomonas denitrificans]